MGVSSSTSSGGSQLQKDIKYLGDRFPFGDDELLLVYCAYQRLINNDLDSYKPFGDDGDQQEQMKQQPRRFSFLMDIAMVSLEEHVKGQQRKRPSQRATSISTEFVIYNPTQQLEERRLLMEVVEEKILPPEFGNTLYRQCFLRPGDKSEYDQDDHSNVVASSVPDDSIDEYTRIARLEKFFEGLSDGTRRGSKASIQCMIRCCTPQEPPSKQDDANATPTVAPAYAYNNVYGEENNAISSRDSKIYVRPLEFVTIGYRVGLAAAFLKATTAPTRRNDKEGAEDDELDVAQFLPPLDDTESGPGLQALANSLSDVSLKRQQRMYRTSTLYTQADLIEQLVDEEDILEWAEQVGPMYGSILPTFLHLIFFPNKPTPPSRTSFDYPKLSQESSLLSSGNSPLLFSFGCMSSALGGEVREPRFCWLPSSFFRRSFSPIVFFVYEPNIHSTFACIRLPRMVCHSIDCKMHFWVTVAPRC
jgi:hypothetical protein